MSTALWRIQISCIAYYFNLSLAPQHLSPWQDVFNRLLGFLSVLLCCELSPMDGKNNLGWMGSLVSQESGEKRAAAKNTEKKNNLYILSCCTTVYTTPPSHVTCGASKNQNNNFFLTLSAALGEFISKLKYSTDQRCLLKVREKKL